MKSSLGAAWDTTLASNLREPLFARATHQRRVSAGANGFPEGSEPAEVGLQGMVLVARRSFTLKHAAFGILWQHREALKYGICIRENLRGFVTKI